MSIRSLGRSSSTPDTSSSCRARPAASGRRMPSIFATRRSAAPVTSFTPRRAARAARRSARCPEQMPYLEWLHSDYPDKYSCQQCHMPEVHEEAPISSVLGMPRPGVHQHVFVGDNFFMQLMLNRYRDDLDVAALPQELTAAAQGTLEFLHTQAAKLELRNVEVASGKLQADVFVENLTGHKLPTAYPVAPRMAAFRGSRSRWTRCVRVGGDQSGWLDRGQRQRCGQDEIRTALPRDHQRRAGRDLRRYPGRPGGQSHHRIAASGALFERQSPVAAWVSTRRLRFRT